jgi:hypothetical protein
LYISPTLRVFMVGKIAKVSQTLKILDTQQTSRAMNNSPT